MVRATRRYSNLPWPAVLVISPATGKVPRVTRCALHPGLHCVACFRRRLMPPTAWAAFCCDGLVPRVTRYALHPGLHCVACFCRRLMPPTAWATFRSCGPEPRVTRCALHPGLHCVACFRRRLMPPTAWATFCSCGLMLMLCVHALPRQAASATDTRNKKSFDNCAGPAYSCQKNHNQTNCGLPNSRYSGYSLRGCLLSDFTYQR